MTKPLDNIIPVTIILIHLSHSHNSTSAKSSPLMLQQGSPDSEGHKSTDQKQLDSIRARFRKASQDFASLNCAWDSWGWILTSHEEQAFMLHEASPRGLHEREITTITTAELNASGNELSYQTNVLIPSPILNARQLCNDAVVYKSDVRALISDFKLLELNFPNKPELRVHRCDLENKIRDIDRELDIALYMIRDWMLKY